ncbi:MAG: Na+/H+ antiporter NhaC family protein [Planctomycetota bacterium]
MSAETQPHEDQRDRAPLKHPGLLVAVTPVVVLIVLLGINVALFGADSSFGPNQIALLFAAAMAGGLGAWRGIPMATMVAGAEDAIRSALKAILILLLIGALAGTWMMSGIVPAMIYYGLDILNPRIFLVAATIICAVVSLASGSSWSTVATVGIALLGIGTSLGISQPMAAGAIISGAYFGDKVSPLSDTTNLASAMAGIDLVRHIRYLLWTTVPSFLIALLLYLVIGLRAEPTTTANVAALKVEVASHFDTLSPWLLVVPVAVLGLVVARFDAIAALFMGAVLAGLLAIVAQPTVVGRISGAEPEPVDVANDEQRDGSSWLYAKQAYMALIQSMAFETRLVNGDQEASWQQQWDAMARPDDEASTPLSAEQIRLQSKLSVAQLLRGKGMVGMLNTVWLILSAMCFGGFMHACGFLERISEPLLQATRSEGGLVATTTGSCLFTNVTASDQYLAIVVPGQMFKRAFADRGLAPENLSRTLEDSGTVTSVLVPWNTCGAAQAGVLGVATVLYAPFCFFNLLSPIMTVLVGAVGFRLARLSNDENPTRG